MKRNTYVKVFTISVVSLFLLSAFLILTPNLANSISSSPAKNSILNPSEQSQINTNTLFEKYEKAGVPHQFWMLPSHNAPVTKQKSTISPFYPFPPGSMGVADYGLQTINGVLTGTVLNTTSFEGIVTLNNLSAMSLNNYWGPESAELQLNAVLKNVTLFGNSSYVLWTQNVVYYTPQTQQLEFADAIFNFSNPYYYFTANSLYSYQGTPIPGACYVMWGPIIDNITFPFTVDVYLNSTVINNRDAVFFNYTYTENNYAPVSGSLDEVVFNSTYGMPSSYITLPSYYQINGLQYTPTGYIPYDAEMVLCGPGGGSILNVYSANLTMQLNYLSLSGYLSIPSAYNYGSETGESAVGVSSVWNGLTDKAIVTTGPAFFEPLWGGAQISSIIKASGKIAPSNAFVFISPGSQFNLTLAQWAPIQDNGAFSYLLPSGTYTAEILLSDYRPVYVTFSKNIVFYVNMTRDLGMGVYTPLYAFNNAQLAALSLSGSGTVTDPYILINSQYGSISPLFMEINDWSYTVFSGIFILNTNAYVSINSPPSFFINFASNEYAMYWAYFGNLYSYNFLPIQLYNTSNVSIWQASYVSGWFSSGVYEGIPSVADIELWNCTNDLVGDSMFYDWGSSLMIYGGSGNVIWGNEFLPYLVPLKPSISSVSLFFVTSRVLGEVGLSVYSSNNIIYNNYFGVNVPVYSPSYNIYTGTYTIYTNLWNITPEPASYINIVNGYDLTGNILGGAIQSGNYWSNYVSSAPLPFNSYGYIATGGDYNPIVPVYYTVSMTISGLNSTVLAFLYSNAQNHMFLYSAFGSGTLNIEATNGTYYVLILTTTGIYSSVPAQITVNGANVTITVTLSDQTIIL